MTWYNENDANCVLWLAQLAEAGLIPQGEIDARSIEEIEAPTAEQCHFFAGIAGWAYALQLAGWPTNRPVWTGSCPCQPFSVAGKGEGYNDPRDLWPSWFRLIRESKPPTIFGEQVAGAIGFGWWDRVCTDLESEGYACAATVLPACSVAAPHRRGRLFWVADDNSARFNWKSYQRLQRPQFYDLDGCGPNGGLGHAALGARDERESPAGSGERGPLGGSDLPDGLGGTDLAAPTRYGTDSRRILSRDEETGGPAPATAWSASTTIYCLDRRWRRIPLEPRFQPLADGLPGRRVVALRAAGNAIVPQVAAEFIKAFMETES